MSNDKREPKELQLIMMINNKCVILFFFSPSLECPLHYAQWRKVTQYIHSGTSIKLQFWGTCSFQVTLYLYSYISEGNIAIVTTSHFSNQYSTVSPSYYILLMIQQFLFLILLEQKDEFQPHGAKSLQFHSARNHTRTPLICYMLLDSVSSGVHILTPHGMIPSCYF